MRLATTLLLTALVLLAGPPIGRADDHQTTLTGNFTSGFQDGPEPLRAVFTPLDEPGEEGDFDVVFYFRFNGQRHEYRGSAWGTLDGELRGRVQNETRRRTFTFEGEFDGQTFKGTHAEISRRGERRTGNLTLGG